MRKSTAYLSFIGANLLLAGLMFVHASYTQEESRRQITDERELVRRLELTDLCLFTDARYTRHPSMADIHTAFQDAPMSFDHFPSGSIMPPPPHLKRHETD
ncbi:MAG TPA: hypothetical protein VMB78_05925 [Dissulfurispiraceae bacterium]|nr:hypothetical protein [Dissulfurispiraceae bacterium]